MVCHHYNPRCQDGVCAQVWGAQKELAEAQHLTSHISSSEGTENSVHTRVSGKKAIM